jgi:PKD repeat protein
VQAPENTVQWQWDFGDGTTSNDPNPVHGYDFQGGVFTVCLTIVTADSCTQSYCTEVYVGSGNDPDCQASFTYSVLYSYPPQYAFTDLSSGEVTEWFWDFGDGSYSSESNPVHVFMGKQWFDSLTPGNTDASGGVINDTVPPDGSLMFYYPFAYIYTVCLTITTADGCIQTYCSEVYVDSGNNSDCQARFIYRVLESYPLQYVFSDASSGFPVEWFWDFGDGTYGTDSSVVHVFSNQIWNGGTYPDSTDPSTGVIYDSIAPDNYYMPIIPGNNYQVCLTIITANGCSSTYCEWISSPYDTIINPDPCNYRIKLSTSNILGIPCSGTATASLYDPTFGLDVPASVYWSTGTYGDYVGGLCANMPYYVILTSGGGCTVAGSFAVMDYSVPVYTFGYWSYSGIGNDYRFAYNTPDSSYECYWDFGNGVILEGDAVDYTITEDMTDPVNLTVYDADGNLVHSEQIKVSFEPTGLTEPAVNLFRIYPNPVSDVLYLELGENNYDFVDLTVFDMTGKTVRTHRLPGNNYEPYSIDVSDLAGGIYLARVMYGSRMLGSEKFMK